MRETAFDVDCLYPLRIYSHTFGDRPPMLLEEWRCVGGKAVLLYCRGPKPIYPYVLNEYWDKNNPDSPDTFSPKDGITFLKAMKSRFRSSTYVTAYFDRGVRLS